MGYNLRREFLVAHKADVDNLRRLADEAGWQRVVCDTPEQAMKAQYLINNLLSSLAKWEPQLAYIRERVRTKLEWEPNGKIAVWVGVPPAGQPLRGAIPRPVTIAPANAEDTLTIEETITSENWSRIASALTAAIKRPWVHTIIIQHPPEPAGIKWIAEKLAPHFTVTGTAPQFTLVRES